MRVFIGLLIVVLFLGALGGGIAYWKYEQIQQMQAKMSKPQPPATVAATEARSETWQVSLSSTGSVNAINGIEVTTEVAGKVERIAFESSQRIDQGEVLVELESSVDRAALDGLIAERDLAQTRFERNANLLPRNAISQSQYDESKSRYDAAKAAVAEQRARIAKKTIRAPFDGLLGFRQVDQGEYINPGEAIVAIQALDPIYVDYTVPEAQFSAISVGQTVEVRVDAYPDRTFTGEISAVDADVNEGTRSVDVRATLDNPQDALRPGMFARVQTVERNKKDVVTVPRTAVSFNTYGDFVFRITEGEDDQLKVSRKQVTTGRTRDGRVAVTKGIEPGDRVVRAGLVKLRNGQNVTIDNSVELDDTVEAGES
jgi:membrane fusion protein (multidrug efflux system)